MLPRKPAPALLLAFTLAVAMGWASSPSQAGDIKADRRLPPQVFLYVSCPDAVGTSVKLSESAFGGMINDPAMDEFRTHLLQTTSEARREFEDKAGVLLSDLLAMFRGEVTLAVTRPIGQPLGAVVFVEVGEHHDVLDKLLVKMDGALAREGAEKSTEKAGGTEITVHTFPVAGPRNGIPNSLAYFVKDGTFVAGSSTGILEDVLSRWAGTDENCFANSKAYSAVLAQCLTNPRSVPALTYFVDVIGLTSAGLAMSPETQMAGIMFSGYLPTVGLNKLKGMGGTVELATADFDMVSRSLIYCEQPVSGLLKVFEFRPTIAGPPAWVPAKAGNFFALDWNIAGAYAAIESLYDSFAGGPGSFSRFVDQSTIRADGANLHPKKDVIDALSGSVQGFVNTPNGDNPADIGVLVLGVKDQEKAKKLVETFAKTSNLSLSGDFEGQPIYEADNGPGAVCVKGDQLFVAAGAETLKQALTAKAEGSLAESDAYARIKPHLPEKMSALMFAAVSDEMGATYEKARAGEYDALIEGKIDLSKLPPFEKIKPYLLPSASYVVPTEQGPMTVRFSPKATK